MIRTPQTIAERLRLKARGERQAAILAASAAERVALDRFQRAGLTVERIDDGEYLIAGRYEYHVVAAYWTDQRSSKRNYGWGSLIEDAKRQAQLEAEAKRCEACHPLPAIVKVVG